MEPLIITVAAVGAELSVEQQPNLPITPEALARDAAECAEAGASIYHLHVRDHSGAPTMDVGRFREALAAIKQASDLIVQFTTGGALGDSDEVRIAPLDLEPEMATLTTGTVNFGDGVFMNPAPLIERLYLKMRAKTILPEYEIFDAAMIFNALALYDEHGSDHHRHFDFVLGVPGALAHAPGVLEFLTGLLPESVTWSATGIGRSHLPVTDEILALGGHVRTGFEDVRYVEPGLLAGSNAELIARVAERARAAGRALATASDTRRRFGLSSPAGSTLAS